jgi:hypothetical protein
LQIGNELAAYEKTSPPRIRSYEPNRREKAHEYSGRRPLDRHFSGQHTSGAGSKKLSHRTIAESIRCALENGLVEGRVDGNAWPAM